MSLCIGPRHDLFHSAALESCMCYTWLIIVTDQWLLIWVNMLLDFTFTAGVVSHLLLFRELLVLLLKVCGILILFPNALPKSSALNRVPFNSPLNLIFVPLFFCLCKVGFRLCCAVVDPWINFFSPQICVSRMLLGLHMECTLASQ